MWREDRTRYVRHQLDLDVQPGQNCVMQTYAQTAVAAIVYMDRLV